MQFIHSSRIFQSTNEKFMKIDFFDKNFLEIQNFTLKSKKFFHFLKKYGFVNFALEELVLRNFGEEIWAKIK